MAAIVQNVRLKIRVKNIRAKSEVYPMKYLTASLEDYLEIIYILGQNSKSVRVTDIAKALFISKPSVTRAVSTLKDEKFLNQEKYGKISLTEKGIQAAKTIYDKHKIISEFLTRVLGIDSQTAEIDACKIEHTLSHKTIKSIENFLKTKNTLID